MIIVTVLAMLLGTATLYAQDGFELYRLVQLKSKKTKNKWVANPWMGKQHHYKLIFRSEFPDIDTLSTNIWVDSEFGSHGIHFSVRDDSIAKNEKDTEGVKLKFDGNRMELQWFSRNKNHIYFPENDWVTEEFERINWLDLRPEEQFIINCCFYSPDCDIDSLAIKDKWYRTGFAWTDNNTGETKTTIVPDNRNQDYFKIYGRDYMVTIVATPKATKITHQFDSYSTFNGWLGPVEYYGIDLTREWYRKIPVIHHWIDKDTIHSIWIDVDAWQKKGDTIREVWERVK